MPPRPARPACGPGVVIEADGGVGKAPPHPAPPGLIPGVRRLVAISLINQVGSGAFAGVLVLFLVSFLGLRQNTANTLLSLAAGVGLVSLVPLGVLADRAGLGRMLRAGCLAAFLMAGILTLVRSPVAAGICYVLLVLFDRACNVARNALVPTLATGRDGPRVKARIRSVSNLGYGLGAAIGAGLLALMPHRGFAAAVLLNAASYAACAVLARTLDESSAPAVKRVARRPGADRRYLGFVAVNGTLSLFLPVFELMLPVLLVSRYGGPSWIIGLCLALNTAAVAGLQTFATRGITDWVSSVRAARVGAAVATAGLAILAAGAGLGGPWLVAAAIAGTLVHVTGEMRGVAGQWELQMGFAPHGRQGQYQATNALGLGAARMLAPWLVALMSASLGIGLAVLVAVLMLAAAVLGPVARRVVANRAQIGVVAPGFGG